ncbi:TnsD family Tn7-like transposition protein [Paenibacillus peoriae]|uniref:TnsD family Tn7-like transposition protein n=1 Tax=Paenibacillus peoriae TaxID=59893 RepID=UPI003F962952
MGVTLYPDELLASFIARNHLLRGHKSIKTTYQLFFHLTAGKTVYDLPSGLKAILQSERLKISLNELIHFHTLYPYYKPFWSMEQSRQVKKEMSLHKSQRIQLMAGVMASIIRTRKKMKICPLCLQMDLDRFGETYWHRTHQLPGVLVCSIHKCLLLENCLECNENFMDQRIQYPALPSTFCKNHHSLNEMIRFVEDPRLFGLSAFSTFILEGGYGDYNMEQIHAKYMQRLAQFGYCTATGRVKQREVRYRFLNQYNSQFLKQIAVPFPEESEFNWLSTILRKPRRAQHPLLHILIIQMLWDSPEKLKFEVKTSPFSSGPWPCLSPISNHYLAYVIPNVKVTRCSDTGKPVGTFECPICGFTYSRRGPDQDRSALYTIGRVKKFGSIWQSKLDRLSKDHTLSLREVSRLMKCDPKTVKRYLTRSVNHKDEVTKVAHYHQRKKKNKASPTTKLLALRMRIDWAKRDQEINKLIMDAIQKINQQEGRPIRLTKARIGRTIGQLAILEKKMDCLPMCKETLQRHMETLGQYQKRRIDWIIKECTLQKIPLKKWIIIRKAGIGQKYAKEMESYITEILKDIC